MSLLHRLRHELTRERSLRPARRAATRRGDRKGVALLLVISIIALMTVLVTEVVYSAGVRIQTAANQRDEAKAEALAQAGLQFYRLILIASKQLEGNPLLASLGPQLGINAGDLWQILPSVSTGLLRMLVFTGGDEDDAADIARQGGLSQDQRDEANDGAQTTLKKSFLDFDGDWIASVTDEDRRIFVGSFKATNLTELMQDQNAALLSGMMGSQEQESWLRERDLEKWELIGNLADWTDVDDDRLWDGSRESRLYESLAEDDEKYPPKNAPFDTVEEIRLVDGWHRDAIWERFGEQLTIYGNGKVNVNTAPRKVLAALLRSHINPVPTDMTLSPLLDVIQTYLRTPPWTGYGGYFRQPQEFVSFVQANLAFGELDPALAGRVATHSQTFRVRSEGIVGDASVTIEAVIDFGSGNQGVLMPGGNRMFGKIVYWRVK